MNLQNRFSEIPGLNFSTHSMTNNEKHYAHTFFEPYSIHPEKLTDDMFTCGLVDQHPILHLGLQIFLEQHFHEINFYPSKDLDDFLSLPDYRAIEMIIIGLDDESQPDWLKIEFCRLKHPRTAIVLYAETLEIESVLRLLKLGVKGVILKKNDPNEILDCIQKIQQGNIYMSRDLENIVFDKMITDKSSDNVYRQYKTDSYPLTVRQHLMATYLIKGMKTSEIAKVMMISPSTVSTVKATILKKTNAANVVELINILKQ